MALTDNLVSYYKFEGNSNDSVGTNNGTDTSVNYNSSYGKIGQGANFNSSSRITITSQPELNLQSYFTLNLWVYQTSRGLGTSYEEGLIVKDNLVTGSRCFDFHIRGSADAPNAGKLRFSYGYPADIAVLSSGVIPLNSWTMCSLVSTAGTYSFYINGVLSGSGATNITPYQAGTSPLYIGHQPPNGIYIESLTGNEDEIGIWSRALSSTEITQLYNGGAGLQYPFSTTKSYLGFF